MADLGKLWFELGVRENVTSELDRIKKEMLAIQQSAMLTALALKDMNDANDKVSRSSAKNAKSQETSMNKVRTSINNITKDMGKLRSLMENNKFGINTTEIERAYRTLGSLQLEYTEALKRGNISNSELTVLNSRLTNARAEAALATQNFSNETHNASASEKEEAKSIKEVNQSLAEHQREMTQNAKTAKDFANTFDKLGQRMQGTNRIMSEISTQIASTFSIYAIENFAKSLIKIGGEFEKQHIALKSMLGDAQQANEIFAQIKSLAPISPFTFRDLTSYAKQLTAFNVPFEELYDTTKRLSDISAGLGVDMSRIILAYGQVRSASVLRGQELRQFTEAGIPIVQALADKLTEMNGKLVTTGEVFDYISKRKVPFEMVKEILWDLTEEGGRFFNMQMVLSDTLAGKWANLQDSWEIMLSTLANSQSALGGLLKIGVSGITELINGLNKLMPMIGAGGVGAGLVMLFKTAQKYATANSTAVTKQILDTKRMTAAQIELNVHESKRTALQQAIIKSKGIILEEDLAILRAEGKISNAEVVQLVNENNINRAKLQQLLIEKGIDEELAKQLTHSKLLEYRVSRIGGFLASNALSIGVMAAGAAIGYFWNESAKASNAASDAASNAAQRYEELKKVFDDTNAKNPTSKQDLQTEIKGIEEALKGVDPYFERTINKANGIDDLREKYKLLREELEKTRDAYKDVAESKEAFEGIVLGKDIWEFWKQSMDENIKDWNDSRGKVQSIITKMGQDDITKFSEYLEDVSKVYPKFREAVYKNGVSGEKNSLFETLNNLIGDSASASEVENNLKILSGFHKDFTLPWYKDFHNIDFIRTTAAHDLKNAFVDVRNDYQTMESQLVKVINDVKSSLLSNMQISEDDIKNLTDNYKRKMAFAINSLVAQWGNAGEAFKGKLYDIAKTNGGFVMQGFLGNASDFNNNSNTDGGSQTDQLLKQWKEDFNELKKFYSQYKKWAKDIGKDAALQNLRKSGIFSSMFDKAGNPIYNIEDWKESLKKFRDTLQGGSIDRDKFKLEVDLEINNFEYDKNHEKLEDAAKRISEYLSDEVAKYNLYEKIFEKTGDKSFARNAFRDGKVWDDLSRGLAQKLAEMLGKSVGDIDFDADSISMEKALEGTQGAFEIWKKIVDLTKDEYNKSLENAADATEKLMNYEERIAKLQAQRAELIRKGASNAEVIAVDKEIMKQQTEQFENSTDYLRFYSAILSMTTDEAERIGTSIRENLVKQLADGNINADKYLKSMRNITQQIDKARGGLLGNSDFATFVNGGQKGLVDKRWEEMASAAIKVQKAEEDLLKAQEKGNQQEITSAKIRLASAQLELNVAKEALNVSEKQYKQLSDISMIADVVMGALNGLQTVAKSVSDMFDALGNENAANAWSDIADGIGIVTDTLKPLDGILKNFMSGNISGMVSNALLAPVNLITAPITGIAKLHDKKLDRAIQQSQFEVKKLQTAYEDLEKSISSRLGGIYGGSEYTKMLENLRMQRTELQKQMEAEDAKKKTDKEKMEDYRKSINEMDEEIRNFAADMAKSLYDIDVKSWAQQLTDAVVSAWAKGEDAAQAFHDKVKDIIKGLAVNILTQKVMEAALQPVFDEIVAEMERKSGKLDEESIDRFASALDARVEQAVPAITSMLEQLKARGWDISESSSTSSSSGLSKGIQGMTEETSNLLASYLNATRADVSVIRQILENVYGSANNMIAQAQLVQLEMIASSTARNADATERIESIFNAVTIGNKHIYIQ